MVLPEVIERVVKQDGNVNVPHDTVLQEMKNIANMSGKESEDLAMAVAVYMLGFSSYFGFSNLIDSINLDNNTNDDNYLKRIYSYSKGL
jgi:hypothetical protein